MHNIRLFALIAATCVMVCSCGGKATPEPTPDPKPDPKPDPEPTIELPSITTYHLGTSFTIPRTGHLLLKYKDIAVGDNITLTGRFDSSVSYKLECFEASDTAGAKFTVPSGYLGGMCNLAMNFKKKSESCVSFINVADTVAVPKKPGKNTYGKVMDIDGKPVAGVVVSDGAMVTVTDADGLYYLASTRKMGYVFISVPAGYKVAVNRSIPQFFQYFTATTSGVYEQHNFILQAESNDRHRMITFTDTHLANRTKDVQQYENFKADLRSHIAKAKAEGVALYAMSMGDLAWDQYWYDNSYSLADYYKTMSDMDIPIYNCPGNHDNDPYVADDFGASAAFRKNIGPTYYSFNVGKVHYIVMDDTIFHNKGGSQGVIGDVQDYEQGFTSEQRKWLQGDLEHVPAGTTVMFATHIQYTSRESLRTDGTFKFNYQMPAQYRQELVEWLAPFKVHYVTGHTHINFTNRITENTMEHNTASICGTWWWTGYYTNNRCHMSQDGSPAGYRVFEMFPDNTMMWRYQGIGRSETYQFRVYDLNNCQITRALYCPASSNPKVSDSFFKDYVHGYDEARSDNKLLVNVFDYDPEWKITATENGKTLGIARVDTYDPLHIIHFNTSRMNTNSTSMTFPTGMTSHMFEVSATTATSSVIITVTDPFGREYTEAVARPRKLYDMSKASNW